MNCCSQSQIPKEKEMSLYNGYNYKSGYGRSKYPPIPDYDMKQQGMEDSFEIVDQSVQVQVIEDESMEMPAIDYREREKQMRNLQEQVYGVGGHLPIDSNTPRFEQSQKRYKAVS